MVRAIPTSFIKGAFLDRIHLYNPGWEIKMLKKDSFSKGYGLITDYIAAILHNLRNKDLTALLKDYAKFDGSLSERDHLAIRKTFSGMVKLIYPDGNMTDEEAFELIDFAAEGRKRVKDQLYIVDETFKAELAKFKYVREKDGLEINVETLEKVSNALIIPENIPQGNTATSKMNDSDVMLLQDGVATPRQEEPSSERQPRKRFIPLQEKNLFFRLGQTGVTYQSLFADYLKDATEITIEDPYIRASWQVKNLMEFLTMLIDTRDVDDLKVHLVTSEDEDKIPDLIDKLDDIKDDMIGYGIEFDYKFREFHDRCIKTDNGWVISMGRGLDIYEKYSPYSVAAARPDKRKCKEFMVTFTKDNQG